MCAPASQGEGGQWAERAPGEPPLGPQATPTAATPPAWLRTTPGPGEGRTGKHLCHLRGVWETLLHAQWEPQGEILELGWLPESQRV